MRKSGLGFELTVTARYTRRRILRDNRHPRFSIAWVQLEILISANKVVHHALRVFAKKKSSTIRPLT